MNENSLFDNRELFLDKDEVRRLIDAFNKEIGFIPNPDATPQKVRESMKANGIREEDNIFSCGIIAARDEE